MRALLLILILGCGLSALQCDDRAISTRNQNVFLIPMAAGNQWHYQSDLLDSSGNIIATSNESVYIYGDTLVGGSAWFGFAGQGYRTNRSDGVWQLLPTPFLEFPSDFGDSVLQGNGGTYMSLISKEERITVPAGTFVSFQFSEFDPQTNNRLVNKYYIAPALGLVKKEVYDQISQKREAVIQLLVYELN